MTYNIRAGRGLDGYHDLERILAVIRAGGADLVALQEVDCGRSRSAGVDQAAWLAARLGLDHAFAPALDLGLDPRGRPMGYGVALLSRRRILQAQVHPLPALPVPGYWHEPRVCLAARVQARPRAWTVLVTHLGLAPAERAAQAAVLAALALAAGARGPVCLLGDLNAPPGAPELATLLAAFPEPGPDIPTFPAGRPQVRLDHILAAPPARAGGWAVMASPASDHRPLLATLTP